MTGGVFSSSSPPTRSQLEDNRLDHLRLLRSRRVGIATYRRLLAEHGSASAALKALPKVAQDAGVRGYKVCPLEVIEAEMRDGRIRGARLLHESDPEYPKQLSDLPDAPPFLWTIGQTDFLKKPIVALVGARNASSLGTRMARRLAKDLGEAGFVVVSGLARGVDAAAHISALNKGTIGVQAGGVDVIYPAENTKLAEDMAAKGLRLSEMPIGQQPIARHFPARNRIIAGLARAVIVVEAAAKSGTLITARDALDIGREVLAVPGHPLDARASGCNMLIRDGAALLRGIDDLLEVLGPIDEPKTKSQTPSPQQDTKSLQNVARLHQQILDRLGPAPVSEEQLIDDLRIKADEAVPALTELELSGQIARDHGGLLVRQS